MDYIKIFPRHIGIKQFNNIPEKTINSWKSYINNQPFNKNSSFSDLDINDLLTKNQRLLEDPIFNRLKSQILINSKDYINNTGFGVKDVQISNSWGYITKLGNAENNFHFHQNSLISGVFYLTEGSPLIFKTDIHQNLSFKTSIINPNQLPHSFYNINPQIGLLVLFPSHLEHAVSKNLKNIQRISIAFNIIPKGEFGYPHQKLYL